MPENSRQLPRQSRRSLHVHWHHIVRDTGAHVYGECRCGHRNVYWRGGGHQPVNRGWLDGGAWDQRPVNPPRRTVAR